MENTIIVEDSNVVTDVSNAMDMADKYSKYKGVNIYRHQWPTPKYIPGTGQSLTDKIHMAKTTEEVSSLLEEGKKKFVKASDKTIRRWELAAANRIKILLASK